MSFKNKYLAPTIVVIIFLSVFFTLVFLERKQENEIIVGGKETVCVAYEEGKRLIGVKYFVSGKEYTNFVGKQYSHIEDGEEFILIYLPTNPESIVVQFDRPVLSDSYGYSEATCLSVSKSFSVLKFSYKVGNQIYYRETVYENQPLNSSNYIVRYRTENPKIGYLMYKE